MESNVCVAGEKRERETEVAERKGAGDTEPRAGCWEAAATAAMLPYPERRENDPREHREAASFVACSGCLNFGWFNSTCWAAQFGV